MKIPCSGVFDHNDLIRSTKISSLIFAKIMVMDIMTVICYDSYDSYLFHKDCSKLKLAKYSPDLLFLNSSMQNVIFLELFMVTSDIRWKLRKDAE